MADDEYIKILKQRYAKGEITRKQFDQMKIDLEKKDDESIISKKKTNDKINTIPNSHLTIKLLIAILVVVGIIIFISQTVFTSPKPPALTPTCAYGNQCEVQPTCPSQFYFNTSLKQCYYRYLDYNVSSTAQKCNGSACNLSIQIMPSCPTGYAAWINTENCESPSTACATNSEYNNQTHMCVPYPICPSDYLFNKALGMCEIYGGCPSGYTLELANPPICLRTS
jgi:hypothetical protein